MSTSIEFQWQSQAERRRRIIKLIMVVLIAFTMLLVALWFWITQPLFSSPTPLATRSAEPARLEVHVRMLSTQFLPRDEGHPENLDRAAAYIRAEFERAKGVVSEQPYEVNGKTYRNVIAWFGPETTQRFVVGAHYDTAGPLPGADDNASDNFVIQLFNQEKSTGYIVVYAGRRSYEGESAQRLLRAKDYLVEHRRMAPERIVTIDGGYKEDLEVALIVAPHGAAAPVAMPTLSQAKLN